MCRGSAPWSRDRAQATVSIPFAIVLIVITAHTALSALENGSGVPAAGGAGVAAAECRTGPQFAAALANAVVNVALISSDIVLSEDDWQPYATPVLLARNVTVLGPYEAMEDWPELDMAFVKGKVVLGPNTVLNFSRVVLVRSRGVPPFQPVGLDLLARSNVSAGGLMDDLPPGAGVVASWGIVNLWRTCLPPASYAVLVRTWPRPSAIPGAQTVNASVPHPVGRCVNSSEGRLMRRCWPVIGVNVDVAVNGLETVANDMMVRTGYIIWAVNFYYLCQTVMSDECVGQWGPAGCYVRTMTTILDGLVEGQGPPLLPAPPPPQDDAPLAPGGGPGGRSRVSLGPLLGGALGGLLAACAAGVGVLVLRRRKLGSAGEGLGREPRGAERRPSTAGVRDDGLTGSESGALFEAGGGGSGGAEGLTAQPKDVCGPNLGGKGGSVSQGQRRFRAPLRRPRDDPHLVPVTPLTPFATDIDLSIEMVPRGPDSGASSAGPSCGGTGGSAGGPRGGHDGGAVGTPADSGGGGSSGAGGGDSVGSDSRRVELSPVVLGKGAFGKVVLGSYRGARVAVKLLNAGLSERPPAAQRRRLSAAAAPVPAGARYTSEPAATPETEAAPALPEPHSLALAPAQPAEPPPTPRKAPAQPPHAQGRRQPGYEAAAAAAAGAALRPEEVVVVLDGALAGDAIASAARTNTGAWATTIAAPASSCVAGVQGITEAAPAPALVPRQGPANKVGCVETAPGRSVPEEPAPGEQLEVERARDGAAAAAAPCAAAAEAEAAPAAAAAAAAPPGAQAGRADGAPSPVEAYGIGSGAARELATLAQEVEVLGRCRHPNVVRLLAANLAPPRVCLVMELMDTSLDRMLHGEARPGQWAQLLPLGKVLHIAMQVARALSYLHPTILHRDLKPANVLVSDPGSDRPRVKIADFGLSRLRNTVLVTRQPGVGTAPYMAPELFDVSNIVVTDRVDIWAFGVILWEMLAGQRPWAGVEPVQIACAILVRRERLPLYGLPPQRCPDRLRALLADCWDAVPERRPAAAELVKTLALAQQALEHPEPQPPPGRSDPELNRDLDLVWV